MTTNRSTFPLSDGFFRIRQGHEHWSGWSYFYYRIGYTGLFLSFLSGAVLVSTDENPNNFGDFNGTNGQQFARYWATADVAGELCIPLDLSRTNISGVEDGANVTIQIMISGGDGNLYQVSHSNVFCRTHQMLLTSIDAFSALTSLSRATIPFLRRSGTPA